MNRPLTKDEKKILLNKKSVPSGKWLQAIAEDFGAAVSAVYEDEIKAAVEAEREACAKVCDNWPNGRDDVYEIGVAIRARGDVPESRQSQTSNEGT